MAISQGGSQSTSQFTSSRYPGKEVDTSLTAGEASDISMGVGQRILDEETPKQEVKVIVPFSLLPAQLIKKYKREHPNWNDQH